MQSKWGTIQNSIRITCEKVKFQFEKLKFEKTNYQCPWKTFLFFRQDYLILVFEKDWLMNWMITHKKYFKEHAYQLSERHIEFSHMTNVLNFYYLMIKQSKNKYEWHFHHSNTCSIWYLQNHTFISHPKLKRGEIQIWKKQLWIESQCITLTGLMILFYKNTNEFNDHASTCFNDHAFQLLEKHIEFSRMKNQKCFNDQTHPKQCFK